MAGRPLQGKAVLVVGVGRALAPLWPFTVILSSSELCGEGPGLQDARRRCRASSPWGSLGAELGRTSSRSPQKPSS